MSGNPLVVEKNASLSSYIDLLCGFTSVEQERDMLIDRLIITVTPRKFREDKVTLEDIATLEFNK